MSVPEAVEVVVSLYESLAHDILGQQLNIIRRFGANSRSVSVYNGVGQYFLLSFNWRFAGRKS